MAWTTPSDVIDSWVGDDAPGDQALLAVWIGRAERRLRRLLPDLQARIDAEESAVPPSTELLDTVRDVVAAMVTRVFRNPEGIRSSNTTTGPFTSGTTFGGENPGTLEPTSGELDLLRPAGDDGRAYTICTIPPSSPFFPGVA